MLGIIYLNSCQIDTLFIFQATAVSKICWAVFPDSCFCPARYTYHTLFSLYLDIHANCQTDRYIGAEPGRATHARDGKYTYTHTYYIETKSNSELMTGHRFTGEKRTHYLQYTLIFGRSYIYSEYYRSSLFQYYVYMYIRN